MYLREMGQVELLSREGEIAIAKRIEAGREAMIQGLCESPLTFQAIIIWRDELNEGKILLRDIIDLEATYAGPDAKNKQPVMSDEKLAEPKKPEPIKKPEPRRPMRRDDEYGDVLSPEDFDKPQVEEDDDEGDDDSAHHFKIRLAIRWPAWPASLYRRVALKPRVPVTNLSAQ